MPQQAEPAPPPLDREPKGGKQDKPGWRLHVTGQADEDHDQPIVHARNHPQRRPAPCRPAPSSQIAVAETSGRKYEPARHRRLALARCRAFYGGKLSGSKRMVANRLIDLSSDTATRPS